MKISSLDPSPKHRINFRRDQQKFVPTKAGCYVLATFVGVVLYIGLTKNLQRRFGDHLDDQHKTSTTEYGSVFYFHWIELELNQLEKVERTWQNECELEDGVLPILNKIKSPVST